MLNDGCEGRSCPLHELGMVPGSECAHGVCPGTAPSASISPAEARNRLEREARRGVCDTPRYRCHYQVWGEGPPLLCIPGLSGDAACFTLVLVHLSRHFRCITYDLPGAMADDNLQIITHDHLVDGVFALLDHLSVQQSYVFGSSFGSTVTLAALRTRPERLPRAVLQAGFARRPLAPAEAWLARRARRWRRPVGRLPLFPRLLRRTHAGPFTGQPPEVWEFFQARYDAPSISAVVHRALLMHRLDLRPMLPEIGQPVLLVGGDQDPLLQRASEEELLHGLPNARRIELTQCGHHPLFTHPAVLAEIVRGFLTPVSAP